MLWVLVAHNLRRPWGDWVLPRTSCRIRISLIVCSLKPKEGPWFRIVGNEPRLVPASPASRRLGTQSMGTGAWVVEYVDRGDPQLPLPALPRRSPAAGTGPGHWGAGTAGWPCGPHPSILQDPSGSLSPWKGRAILCILEH